MEIQEALSYTSVAIGSFMAIFRDESTCDIINHINYMLQHARDNAEARRIAALYAVGFPDYKNVIDRLKKEHAQQMEDASHSLMHNVVNAHIDGKAAAGAALFDDTAADASVQLPPRYADHTRYFSIEVEGDSMLPDINSGDIAVVAVDVTPDQGDLALIRIDDETDRGGYVIKRFFYIDGRYVLKSNNPAYQPITLPPERVLSAQKVVYITRPSK